MTGSAPIAIRLYDGVTFKGGLGDGQWAFGSTSYANDYALYAQNDLLFHAGTGSSIDMMIDGATHNVGIGTSSCNGNLQFSNTAETRKIVLYEGANNDYQFYGFGVESQTLVYSTYTTDDDHVFFAGTSSTTRNELMRIGGDGNVGINETNPDTELHISHNSDTSADGWLTIEDTDTTAGSQRPHIVFKGNGTEIGRIRVLDTTGMQFATGSSTSIAMTIDQSQNVGIGQTSIPTNTRLNITGTNNYTLSSSSGMGGIKISGTTAGQGNYTSGIGFAFGSGTAGISGVQGTADADRMGLAFFTHPSGTGSAAAEEKMRIDYLGNVGIGTSSPSAILHSYQGASGQSSVNANANGLVVEDNASNGISILTPSSQIGSIFFGDQNDNFVGGFRYDHTNNSLQSYSNNAERMRIDSSGKVIVSNSGATNIGILQLSSSVTSYFLRGGANYGYLSYHTGGYHRWFGSDGAEDMRINSDGDVLMNCTSVPSGSGGGAAFETSGTLMRLKQSSPTTSTTKVQIYYNANGEVGSIHTSGTATAFNTSSDYRLKDDYKDFNGLDLVNNINVYV